ncbi:MAG: sigma-70 family RNA polymerase sigma factor [Oscillospiraceae bacterium]|nr:sigma-70 family RNA polymerase sigma factor [Oscillospiraceae bacterium]MBQ4643190.1 sigma-70 family RNA polymerase sigma factor [Oscillospiraceae bacterium]
MTVSKNILGNEEDAKECLNDTYLAAWNSIPPKIPEKLSLFLGKITRNLSLNRYRKNETKKRGGGTADIVFDEIGEIISGSENPEEKFERKEIIGAVNEFLRTLPEEKRSIFICRYWYFDSIEDIAARFGKKESGIYSSLERTRKNLWKYLSERGYEI